MQFKEYERYECKLGKTFCGIIFEKVKLEFWKTYVDMIRIYNNGGLTLPK